MCVIDLIGDFGVNFATEDGSLFHVPRYVTRSGLFRNRPRNNCFVSFRPTTDQSTATSRTDTRDLHDDHE